MMRAVLGVCLITFAMVAPAWAQSETGVSAALVGDIARYNGGGDPFSGGSRDDESLGFSLRLDRALGTRWGVELEYVRSGESETESGVNLLASAELLSSLSSISTSALLSSSPLIFPPRETRTIVRTRLSTVSTLAWYRQSVGERTSLVYSAGLAFGIGRTESTFMYIGLPNQNTLPARDSEYTSYSINPVIGFDARIAMTDHASIVPGLRLLGADGGIRLRPSVGLRWQF